MNNNMLSQPNLSHSWSWKLAILGVAFLLPHDLSNPAITSSVAQAADAAQPDAPETGSAAPDIENSAATSQPATTTTSESNERQPTERTTGSGTRGTIPPPTAEQTRRAVSFARLNHPELASLIDQLQQHDANSYHKAITDLANSAERLTRTRQRSPERYELELAEWKLSSQIRLLAARLAMGVPQASETALREALQQRREIRLKIHYLERDRLEKRLAKVNETISEAEQNGPRQLEQEYKLLLGNAGGKIPKRKPGGANKAEKTAP